MNFFQFQQLFATEEAVIVYFIKIRYNDTVICPHCNSTSVYRRKQSKNFDCPNCNNTFSVFTGTIFEKSSTDLRKWFYAIHLFLNSKKGISGLQLQREIGVTYKTAWRMLRLIREAMGNEQQKEFMNSIIEIDEAYVGTPDKDDKDDDDNDKPNKRGRGSNKPTVIGILNRTDKKVQAKVMVENEDGQKLTGKQILSIIKDTCKTGNKFITDDFKGYTILDKEENNTHITVNHSECYSDKKGGHINNLEAFWGTLKRGVYGIYHHVSAKYLQNYIDEFCFRYNNRENANIFDKVLKQCIL